MWELKNVIQLFEGREKICLNVNFPTKSKYQSNGTTTKPTKKRTSSDIISNEMALLNDLSHQWIENQQGAMCMKKHTNSNKTHEEEEDNNETRKII